VAFLLQVLKVFSITVPRFPQKFPNLLRSVAILAALGATPISAQTADATALVAEEYVLGASDKITIRMVAWDSTALAFTRFTEIEGEYTIAANGVLLLPLIGPIEAAGQTPSVLSEMITVFLQQSIGLAEEPSTTVEVSQYRPIYILGDVQRPGAYEYRPGLRVDQAIALAGGLSRAEDLSDGATRTQLRDLGSLREASIQRVQQAARVARLTAETDGAEDIVFPQSLRHPDGPNVLDEIYGREEALFVSRRESLRRALASLDETEELLITEANALQAKMGGLDKQLELLTTQIEGLEQLVERGLARSPTLVALQSSLIDLQARQTDVETASFRAQQRVTEIERDRIDLETRRQENALSELQNVRTQLAQTETRVGMLEALQREGSLAMSDISEDVERVLTFSIARGDETDNDVERTAPLAPLDVLEVSTVAPDTLETPAGE